MSQIKTNKLVTEICVDSVEAVVAANAAGADRVELCSALLEGGLTPSLGMVVRAMAVADNVKVHVMIRPRGGDFLYTDPEFQIMKEDIVALKNLGVHGFVFGMLNADGTLDLPRSRELISMCRPASVTFHRAFDVCRDPFTALNELIELGVDRLLTSGQEPTVIEGAPLIRKLISRASDKMIVMPGSGISKRNVARVLTETGAKEIHFTAFERHAGKMQYRNDRVHMGGALRPPEYERAVTTTSAISQIIQCIDSDEA